MSDGERWERRTAMIGADDLASWLERAAVEGWELVATIPEARPAGGRPLAYYVILRRPDRRPPD